MKDLNKVIFAGFVVNYLRLVIKKVRDHCHISRKYRGAAHWSCIINLKISKKIPVLFHNLKGYDSYLIFK